MSKEAASRFLSRISKDAQLQRQLGDAQAAAVVAFAAEHGFEFTNDELAELASALMTPPSSELSEEQLTAVAGGLSATTPLTGTIQREVLEVASGLKRLGPGAITIVVTYGAGVPGSGQSL
jgi:predicted ribosomally synthesized peptide with nif11-like leader